ncbi:NO-inducible flavohemoprotein [Methylonatrum kenyense]|uniref:NO-inducible flavohemoprotein n=1 Tax=Methylonatrum kenyense TaxID=455253 RepID=UPI0020BEC3E9|nr:NO-inducible flavohemoprotein [Methylonatrum kenyense]MCK8514957.1 NO-inducible flavohemoprotein [Methylonatrum kenyense]
MLNTETREVIKATAPVLAEHGLTITRRFYQRMFEQHPELKNLFNQSHQAAGDQPKALANAVHAYAMHIDNPQVLASAIERIAHKHVSLRVQPEQYAIVGEHLLGAIKDILGDAATDQIIDAWAAAYQQLADILIEKEAALYRDSEQQPGGWSDWRPFVVADRVRESAEIVSFYLHPQDDAPVPPHRPGQYISVRTEVPDWGLKQPRQYSLSDEPNGRYLRISVKREAGREDRPDGVISSLLHEKFKEGTAIELSAPFGDFRLHQERSTPVVLICGGVGITPLLCMLKALARTERQVLFVHGARNREVQAFRDEVEAARRQGPNRIRTAFFLETPDGGLEPDEHHGQVDLNRIDLPAIDSGADYYLCGPLPFIRLHRDLLLDRGVDPANIHYEVFGSDVLAA